MNFMDFDSWHFWHALTRIGEAQILLPAALLTAGKLLRHATTRALALSWLAMLAVTLVATFPNVLVAHPDTAKSLPDLISQLKASPGKYNFGSSGAGSSTHLAGELFKQMTVTDINHIPYKGTSVLLNDLMAGHVSFAFDQITGVMSMVQSGKLRALGVAGRERSPALPEVPAIGEVLSGYEAMAWVGIFAAARTPAEIVSRIQTEVRRIVHGPDIAQRLRELGATPVGSAPEEFTAFLRTDTEKWRTLVRTANIKVE